MDNNYILIRLRFAFDIKDEDMVEIFKLGDVEVTEDEVKKMLVNQKNLLEDDFDDENKFRRCYYKEIEGFLNGFIISKRGKQEPKEGVEPVKTQSINAYNINNMMLKKVKIALGFSSEDMLEIFALADLKVTKGELGALFRKEGHKNYKECGDKFARNFLKGLAIKFRK